ncbi:hypothetical protein [Halobacillus sp. Marseille-Q1614]|uniref:hypothetical protein n=1 Tax=Halobacillus sp. Marseille-Q1614 TaxID=2709134 RepID=UPI00156FB682|nr:hypothetical protein [Halobacillus sp. Marseille-Q1614]
MLRLLLTIGLILLTAGCYNTNEMQGHTNRQDIMDMGVQKEPSPTTDNPRSIERVGDTWGLKQDRDQIRNAAHTVPGVHVQRIIMENNHAWVTVSTDKKLADDEKEQWTKDMAKTIRDAVPGYDVTVKTEG